MRINKGFVLTLDVLFAVAVAMTMSFLILSLFSSASINYFERHQLSSFGNDLLSVLHQEGILNSYIGKTELEANTDLLQQLHVLPVQYCANISVSIFDSGDFSKIKLYGAANCAKHGDITKVKRIFVDYAKGKFGLVEMELWLK